MNELEKWTVAVCEATGLTPLTGDEQRLVLDLARDVAHGVLRPAAPRRRRRPRRSARWPATGPRRGRRRGPRRAEPEPEPARRTRTVRCGWHRWRRYDR